MGTKWRKLGLFLIAVSTLYIFLVGLSADFAQVLTLKHGVQLLVLLLVFALVFQAWELGRRLWQKYRVFQNRLEDARDLVMRSAGKSSDTVLLCAKTQWLFHQALDIRVSQLKSGGLVMLDVSKITLKPGDLMGMHFTILGSEKGVSAKGIVKTCDPSQACIKLYEQREFPCVGDLAVPIEPPQATDIERLLGNVLFIVGE